MFTMDYGISVGSYRIGMLDSVEIHRSLETLADTAVIVLPGAEYNRALRVEEKIKRGDAVYIALGYRESGIRVEFEGFIQRIATDDGNITLYCEDELFLMRKSMTDAILKNVSLSDLLKRVVSETGAAVEVDCDYEWKYEKFVINHATGYDVLKKIQEECGADIYLKDGTLHLHAAAAAPGKEVKYDFSRNIEESSLEYKSAVDRKVQVVVKALLPDGKVKEIEVGYTGGEKIEVKCATSDSSSMKARGEAEVSRLTYDGYEGNITTWLVPYIRPGDTANLNDADYEYKNGRYQVREVTTTFSREGGRRVVELGFKL